MKNIIAAFLWDGSGTKSISYMIIDDKYNVRCKPQFKKMNANNKSEFEKEAGDMVRTFFEEVNSHRNAKATKIKIEYKIVSHASPSSQFHTQLHKPSDKTEFVRDQFFIQLDQANNDGSLQLEKQYQRKLRKPELDDFKREMNDLEIVSKQQGNAFEYHLWSLALHATKSNFQKKLRKLKQTLMPVKVAQKDRKKRHAG